MKKNGFTLIELLAVIVILAIIALIATPLVLKYIEKSRSESKVDSAYSYVRNLETEIANYSIKKNGKKFSVTPASGDYYVEDDFKDNEVDTKVKGDKPASIKVCLSSLGQIEKGVFKYGKYYVSYDGKRGNITDKDSYNNFSCKTVAGGDSDVLTPLLTLTLDIASDDSSVGMFGLNADQVLEFKARNTYCITMTDVNTQQVVIENLCGNSYSDGMVMGYDDDDYAYMYGVSEGSFVIVFYSGKYDGTYEVTISKMESEFEPHSLRIEDNGTNWLYSVDLIEGSAHVLITDENDTIYCDRNTTLGCGNGLCGVYSYDDHNLGELNNVYDAIVEGKLITVKVTQIVEGKEVVTSFADLTPTYIKNSDGTHEYYVIGNTNMPHAG